MKTIRQHVGTLAVMAFAVLAMLTVSSVTFAPPISQASDGGAMSCADMKPTKGSPRCAKDCAAVCHALIIPPPLVGRTWTSTQVTYPTVFSRLTSVTVDGDDPPPRSLRKA